MKDDLNKIPVVINKTSMTAHIPLLFIMFAWVGFTVSSQFELLGKAAPTAIFLYLLMAAGGSWYLVSVFPTVTKHSLMIILAQSAVWGFPIAMESMDMWAGFLASFRGAESSIQFYIIVLPMLILPTLTFAWSQTDAKN